MNILFYFALFLTSLVGLIYPQSLIFILIFSIFSMVYLFWKKRGEDGFVPKSEDFKELEKIKKKRLKSEEKQHIFIADQIAYISKVWGYTKTQEKIINDFLEQRAYVALYNKFSASLLPQMTLLIENCKKKEEKGCKREVSSRLRELTDIMSKELKKKKFDTQESFETSIEVYDHLLREVK